MLSSRSIDIDDFTHIHVVGRSVVRNGFRRQSCCRIVDLPDFLLLAFFNPLCDWVDRSRYVIDVADRTIWCDSQAVLVVKTICLYFITEFSPVFCTRNEDIFKEFFDAIRFWYKFSGCVLIKVATVGIV